MNRFDRTPADWFAEAARCYVERHQGCAWCGGSYRVFHTKRSAQSEYYCHGCDFRAGFDASTECYFSYPGEEAAATKPRTMHEV
jgi:hypothetical protein